MPLLVTPVPPSPAAIVADINVVRHQHGLAKLIPTKSLRKMATVHDRDMLRTGVLTHNGEGTNFNGRVHRHVRFRGVGEAIAWSTARVNAATVVKMWMNSPPHRAELLNPTYRRIGVGTASGQLGRYGTGVVVTADLATRR
jgi:uncharacterized protein YkwD